MIYAGIGARATPGNILHSMVQVGTYMAKEGHVLRSGGAAGADYAFDVGASFRGIGLKEIYLPIKNWNGHKSKLHTVSHEAMVIAAKFHPRWDPLPTFVKLLMGRNSYQILGPNLKNLADFVVCWTPDGKVVGGTGQALRMAAYYEIPVINFGSLTLDQVNERLMKLLEG